MKRIAVGSQFHPCHSAAVAQPYSLTNLRGHGSFHEGYDYGSADEAVRVASKRNNKTTKTTEGA